MTQRFAFSYNNRRNLAGKNKKGPVRGLLCFLFGRLIFPSADTARFVRLGEQVFERKLCLTLGRVFDLAFEFSALIGFKAVHNNDNSLFFVSEDRINLFECLHSAAECICVEADWQTAFGIQISYGLVLAMGGNRMILSQHGFQF
jgi:hypothetical protein